MRTNAPSPTVSAHFIAMKGINMNTVIVPAAAPVVNAPAREVAADKFGAVPALTPLTHIAYLWGLEDAQAGRLCCPEMLWADRARQVAYATGYERISGPTMTTRQILWGIH